MTEPADPTPEPRPSTGVDLRASDEDRERVVELLREAAGDGRLDVSEFDERTSAAYAARTLGALDSLTRDLVPVPGDAAAAQPVTESGLTVRPGPGGTRWIVSFMSGHEYTGRWRLAARCLVLNLMGGSELDLSEAELADRDTEIRVVSVMGGGKITVPAGVDVQVSRFAIMGGHNVALDGDPPPPGAPVIRIKLFALMGGSEVRAGGRGNHRSMRRVLRGEE